MRLTKDRLNRVVTNKKWVKVYNDFWGESLVPKISDHRPILVYYSRPALVWKKRKKPYRYKASWSYEEDCSRQMESLWNMSTWLTNTVVKVQKLLNQCKKWAQKMESFYIKNFKIVRIFPT